MSIPFGSLCPPEKKETTEQKLKKQIAGLTVLKKRVQADVDRSTQIMEDWK